MNRLAKLIAHVFLGLIAISSAATAHTGLDSPNGGEIYTTGEVVSIRWHIYILHPLENWDLWYTVDNGTTFTNCADQPEYDWMPIAADIPPTCLLASGSCPDPGDCQMEYLWTVPEGIDSDQVKIRVRMDNEGFDYYDVSDEPFSIRSTVSVPEALAHAGLVLGQNSPNPFRPMTIITFALGDTGPVRLAVHDVAGRVVDTLVEETRGFGYHAVVWQGTDHHGTRLPSGTYFYTLEFAGKTATRKLVILE
jgi:hypothetical protein